MYNWIFIDSYIEITFNTIKKECLLYNVLDCKKLTFNNKYYELIKQLYENGYVLKVENESQNEKYFYETLEINHFGGMVNMKEKPFIFFPKLNLQQDYKKLKTLDYRDEGRNVLNYLTEFVFYLDGNRSSEIERIKKFIYQLHHSNVMKIILNISNLNNELRTLINEVSMLRFHITIDITFIDFIEDTIFFKEKNRLLNCNLIIKINTNQFVNNIQILKGFELSLIVVNEKDYIFWDKVNSELGVYSFYLSIKEIDLFFLQKYVFLEKEDVNNIKIIKRDYDANRMINKNFFGRLVIKNSKVYAGHCEGESICMFGENLNELAFKAISCNNDWFLTRDKIKPCNNCIFRNLCPPISEYEIKINSYNFCNIVD